MRVEGDAAGGAEFEGFGRVEADSEEVSGFAAFWAVSVEGSKLAVPV